MNHGFSQRENVGRKLLSENKGENDKPLLQSTNANKRLGLSLKPTSLLSETKPLSDQNGSSRSVLSNKGNNTILQSKVQIAKNFKETKVTTSTSPSISPSATTKVLINEPIINETEDTLDELAESTIEDFFEDNLTRYEESEEEFIGIVPVLPIKVPDDMKHLFMKSNGTARSLDIKRSFDSMENTLDYPDSPIDSKKLKITANRQSEFFVDNTLPLSNTQRAFDPIKNTPDSTNSSFVSKKIKNTATHPNELFVENAPPIQFNVNEETINHDHEQEMRAKLAMLQTTKLLSQEQLNDPMLVAEYADEIFGNLFDAEPDMMADPTYANSQQHEVSWKMRGVLVDWVLEIHYLFGLLPETLYLAVNIIDRFLSARTVALGKLQLVGITSLFIAAKFEETICPSIQDFLSMTDDAVTNKELIKAERFIMQILDFRLCYPNPLNFLRRVCSEEMNCDVHTRTLAKYFVEASCMDHAFIGVRPSKIAAAALWLSKKMLAKGKWDNNLTKLSGYEPHDFRSTVEALLEYFAQPITHDAFFKKWSSKKLSKASIFVRDWINRYYVC